MVFGKEKIYQNHSISSMCQSHVHDERFKDLSPHFMYNFQFGQFIFTSNKAL